jgi:hypothetical protein
MHSTMIQDSITDYALILGLLAIIAYLWLQ